MIARINPFFLFTNMIPFCNILRRISPYPISPTTNDHESYPESTISIDRDYSTTTNRMDM